jgi:hypothetical protein
MLPPHLARERVVLVGSPGWLKMSFEQIKSEHRMEIGPTTFPIIDPSRRFDDRPGHEPAFFCDGGRLTGEHSGWGEGRVGVFRELEDFPRADLAHATIIYISIFIGNTDAAYIGLIDWLKTANPFAEIRIVNEGAGVIGKIDYLSENTLRFSFRLTRLKRRLLKPFHRSSRAPRLAASDKTGIEL